MGVKKAAPAKGGMGSKRSRAAEVHNLSERVCDVSHKTTLIALFISSDFYFVSSVLVLEFKIISGAYFEPCGTEEKG